MIYLNVFYVVEMQPLKSGPSWEKWGKMGVKSLSQNPHLYTTLFEFSDLNDVAIALTSFLSFNYANIHAISPMIYHF